MKVKVCGGRDAFLGGKKIALMRESEQEDLEFCVERDRVFLAYIM